MFIPYLEQHTELSQEDEMQLDAFMASESYWYKEKEELLEQAKKFIDDYAYKNMVNLIGWIILTCQNRDCDGYY